MAEPATNAQTTRLLLLAGVAISPWFVLLSLLQAAFSPGFDLTKHEVSLLLAGPTGWIQTLTFLITGALTLVFAAGIRGQLHPGRAGTSGPILMALFGILFIIAGLDHPDPQLGFRSGAPAGVPTQQSVPSNIHSFAFSALALCAVAFCFVFVRKFAAEHRRGWAVGSAACAVAIVLFVSAGSALMPTSLGGLPLLGAAVAITGSVSSIALHLERRAGEAQRSTPSSDAATSAAHH